MRFLSLFLLQLFMSGTLIGQINLVQNPSFEDSLGCPAFQNPNITLAKHWAAYRGDPDYFHTCANNGPFYPNGQPVFGIPANRGGSQSPYHGNAYAGFFTWCCINGNNNREILGTILSSYLTIGVQYYFSCYVSNGDSVESNASTNNIGIMLSTIPYNGTPGYTMSITNYCLLNMDSVVNDKQGWTRFSGSFIADSAYRFLAIGNFHYDSFTAIDSTPGVIVPMAYYYIDAVCLTTDSVYNNTWTNVKEINENNNKSYYPNPANTTFYFENKYNSGILFISHLSGRLIKQIFLKTGLNEISVSDIPKGIYILQTEFLKPKKLIVIH